MSTTLNNEIMHNVLAQLDGWQGDAHAIHRTLDISEAEHAELAERIKVVSDAMRLRPAVLRSEGHTHIHLHPSHGDEVTTAEVTLAARIETAYRTIAGPLGMATTSHIPWATRLGQRLLGRRH